MPLFDYKINYDDLEASIEGLIRYMKWFTQNIDETNLKVFAWGDSQADNVDATHKLKLKFYVPDSMINVQKLKLNFSVENYRYYDTGIYSGGGSTSGASSASTSASGGAVSSGASSESTSENDLGESAEATYASSFQHQHGYWADGGANVTDYNNTNTHVHTYFRPAGHTHGIEHTHTGGSHSHGMEHTHTGGSHSHGMEHTHSTPNHTHSTILGISESTSATGVKVYVDGTLRLDNGGSGYTTDQSNLDLTEWVKTSGWHYIELSSTQNGRINAAYFIQVLVGSSGI